MAACSQTSWPQFAVRCSIQKTEFPSKPLFVAWESAESEVSRDLGRCAGFSVSDFGQESANHLGRGAQESALPSKSSPC